MHYNLQMNNSWFCIVYVTRNVGTSLVDFLELASGEAFSVGRVHAFHAADVLLLNIHVFK
jgi:hypothetical protein